SMLYTTPDYVAITQGNFLQAVFPLLLQEHLSILATQVIINMPMKNLNRLKAFFAMLDSQINPQFSYVNSTSMVISDNITAMLLVESYFQTFTQKPVSDATKTTEVLIALDAASREEVQETIAKAKELGATIYSEPQDHGWMYQHAFADPDGHQWEIAYMDISQFPQE